ncbi:REP-associated tyrosine transposase [Pseudomonas anguilliseptica]|uniref:REP-associated tyrosine transposase n=1 Tax=Pseudomonas anguilliseptica TaxID=53406 RepID=UPI0022AF939A|nr:transposase [Pseudomonas anguilliseptica]MCZ4321933.1 transposase [Pseudomonas anguilliseptica]
MPHSKQLRIGRFSEDKRIYLLTATVEKREPVFMDFQLGRLLSAELKAAHVDGLVESLAWVVMPDHLHWLLVLQRGSLSELMRRVKGRSARQINLLVGRSGRLWQDGFHDHALRHEEDVLPVARYIVANPIRAGLVERVGDYPLWDALWL